jgi:putative tryptophan/tyrosine transport system substrate-binding protein
MAKLREHNTGVSIIKRVRPIIGMALGLFLLGGAGYAQEVKLALVYSDSLETTLRTIKGIKSTIILQYATTSFSEFYIPSSTAAVDKNVDEIAKTDPRLILTVGSYATRIVTDRIKDKPIIFSSVLNPETSGFVKSLSSPGGNVSGASLDIPPEIQFNYFKRVIKSLKKIGVMYTSETENLIAPAKVMAQAIGLDLIAVKIESEKDIPTALEKLIPQVDGIWSVADGHIFSPTSTRFILLNALRSGKPFMGFSRNLVESGALFALDFDYKDIGKQAGKIALEVLSGHSPSTIPVAVPAFLYFHYNEKTAKHISVTIPDDLAAVAKEVYR